MKDTLQIMNREINQNDITLIRSLIETEGIKGRTYISKRLCEQWQWKNQRGIYRDIACRQLLRRLEQKGFIKLPVALRPSRKAGYKNRVKIAFQQDESLLRCSVTDFSTIDIEQARGNSKEQLFNGLISQYHYLGYQQQSGEQLKYIVYGDKRVLACIGFGAAAFKTACRDQYIGWDASTRQRELYKVINNNRFLILPWIEVKNLASLILSRTASMLRRDYQKYYCHDVVFLETFVEQERFRGTCYKAANWIYLGQTQGRGRNDRNHLSHLAVKDVYGYSLVKSFRKILGV